MVNRNNQDPMFQDKKMSLALFEGIFDPSYQ